MSDKGGKAVQWHRWLIAVVVVSTNRACPPYGHRSGFGFPDFDCPFGQDRVREYQWSDVEKKWIRIEGMLTNSARTGSDVKD